MSTALHRSKCLCFYGQMHSARWLLATTETIRASTLFRYPRGDI